MKENLIIDKSIAFAARIVKLHQHLVKSKKETIISKQIVRNLNRRKLKENVYSPLLFRQGRFFGVLRVDELLKSAKAFENLLNIKYRIILGRRIEK